MRRNHAVAALVAAGLISGCGGSGRDESSPPPSTPDSIVASDEKPVPEGCEAAAPKDVMEAPRDLIVPKGSQLLVGTTRKRADDPDVTIVEGYIEVVPDDLVRVFERTPGARVVFKEMDGVDAEVLLTSRRSLNFWKLVRACAEGSRFTALVEPKSSGGAPPGAVEEQTRGGD